MAKMTPAEAMTAMLEALAPSQRPFGYGQLLEAAQALTSGSGTQAALILGVLGTSQLERIANPAPAGVPHSFAADNRGNLENRGEREWRRGKRNGSEGGNKDGGLRTQQKQRPAHQGGREAGTAPQGGQPGRRGTADGGRGAAGKPGNAWGEKWQGRGAQGLGPRNPGAGGSS